jgi:hypothetical protein
LGQVNKPEIEDEELPESIKTGRIYFLYLNILKVSIKYRH